MNHPAHPSSPAAASCDCGLPGQKACYSHPPDNILHLRRGCTCACHAHITSTPAEARAAALLITLSSLYDAVEEAAPGDVRHRESPLYQVALAHLSDGVDALRVLAGHITPDDVEWADVMPADVQEAAQALYAAEPEPHPIDNDCDADPSDADRVDALLARLEAAHV